MSIFGPRKELNINIITDYNEKMWENTPTKCGFLGNFNFLTDVTCKFYQKSNSSPKNNLFSKFLGKCFKSKNGRFWTKHILTCFIKLRNVFF